MSRVHNLVLAAIGALGLILPYRRFFATWPEELSPERRREIAKKAAEARWAKKRHQEEESS
jgi:hypothetical protein